MDDTFSRAFGASMMAGGSPCFECPDRKLGCHDGCPKYNIWKLKIDKAHKEIKKYFIAESYERTQRGLRELRRYTYYDSTR